MGAVTEVECRNVAPLIARYNDPDLTEAERITLGLHLTRCPACQERLQQHRALDRQLRGMRPIALESRVRAAILECVAAASTEIGASTVALPWRHAWSSAVIMFSLTTFLLAAGLTTSLATQRPDARASASAMTNGALVRPATMALLNANPTRVAGPSGELFPIRQPVVQAQATRPAAVAATIRSVDQDSGRIVVAVVGAPADERMIVMRDTAIVLPNGYPGTIADLVAGLQVQLQRDTNATGGVIAREIMVGR